MKQLEEIDGVRLLGPAPAVGVRIGAPPYSLEDDGVHRYLWVIDARGIPYIFEAPVPTLGDALPKHTNLTGGREAYLGGEMWFASYTALYVSGGSGRYPPTDREQFDDVAKVFKSYNYEVTSLGWDDSNGIAMRYLEEG